MVAAVLIKGLPKIAKKGWKTLTTTAKHKNELRIKEINKKLKKTPHHAQQDVFEDHIDEVKSIYDEGKK